MSQTLGAELAALMAERGQLRAGSRTVIAIAGESGSGKTVTAEQVAAALGDAGRAVMILHQDDYFFRPPATNHAHREQDLTSVGPQEVNLSRLESHVAAFRAGTIVTGPRVDYPGNRFLERLLDFTHAEILVVEGTYVLACRDADVRIFMAATSDDTRQRRRERNRDIDAPFVDDVLAIEHRIISVQSALADILVDREFKVVARP